MLSTANRTTAAAAGGDDDEAMDRSKPLHNFHLSCLKWGNQKLLRCMKVDSNRNSSVLHRNHPPTNKFAGTGTGSGGGGGGGGFVIGTKRRRFEFEKGFRSSNSGDDYRFSPSEKLKARIGIGNGGDGEIEATREKLMFDFQKEVGKMKDAILRERLVDPPALPSPATANPPSERPWNLRTRRAACKAPRSPSNGINTSGEVLKPNSSSSSPARNDCKFSNLRQTETSGEKIERPKFSVSLSRRELEEDFIAMAGRRLPRKPKKRPRIVQKQLDTLFPGLWLSEITADLYKVPEETDAGKR